MLRNALLGIVLMGRERFWPLVMIMGALITFGVLVGLAALVHGALTNWLFVAIAIAVCVGTLYLGRERRK